MKEVRLNDKIWFGKYKGVTIKELLNSDRYFLDSLIIKRKIKFSQNVINYLGGNNEKMKKYPNIVFNYNHDDWA